jgi:oxygen-independent coproporphyrinogen-3 oxidase
MKRWKKDLSRLVDLDPEHISTYSLTVEEQTQLFKLVKSKKVIMPSEIIDIDMYTYMLEFLKIKNYIQYEVSNHSKGGYRCNHNMHYWKNDPYISFGPSAHSYDLKKRWWNMDNLNLYTQAINNNELPIKDKEYLTKKDYFNELIFNGLRMHDGVNVKKLSKYYNKSIEAYIKLNTEKWNGLNYENGFFFLDDNARLLADEIASDLFI